MIIAKFRDRFPSQQEASLLKSKLEEFFEGERVLVVPFDVELIFRDECKKRCSHCAMLGNGKDSVCKFCGAPL